MQTGTGDINRESSKTEEEGRRPGRGFREGPVTASVTPIAPGGTKGGENGGSARLEDPFDGGGGWAGRWPFGLLRPRR